MEHKGYKGACLCLRLQNRVLITTAMRQFNLDHFIDTLGEIVVGAVVVNVFLSSVAFYKSTQGQPQDGSMAQH